MDQELEVEIAEEENALENPVVVDEEDMLENPVVVDEEDMLENPVVTSEEDTIEVPVSDFEGDISESSVSAIPTSFGTVTGRLSEIADIVEDESLSLDNALNLLEEAVALSMQASTLLETDMNERDAAQEAAEDALDANDIEDFGER